MEIITKLPEKMNNKIASEKKFLTDIYKRRFTQESKEQVFRNNMWEILVKEYFQKFIPSNSTVLDIPSGNGEFISAVKAKKKIAIDLNPASKKYVPKNATFIESSSERIPLQNESIDRIFVSNFFEHITRESIVNTLKEFQRILKPKGKVLVLQPNIRFASKDYWMFFDHITPIDDRALDEIFELHSMKLNYKVERFLPYTTKSSYSKNLFFLKLYLKLPLVWRFFGQQSFIIYEKV